VQLVGGMFDLGVPAIAERVFDAQVPDLSEPWRIGCIVGPSGSGKSTLARSAFGKAVWREPAWPARRAIVDCFGDIEVRTITSMLTAVGFSSPPAWIRPYSTLSSGEQFRANLARALIGAQDLLVYDEFTSVVDRTVAQIGSAAVAKSLRKGIVSCRFVAVTCHYDVLPWLQPDWVLDTSDMGLSRRRLRRPQIPLEICRCLPDAWGLFKTHHYLSATLARQCRCFLAIHHEAGAVAFAAVLPCLGLAGASRVSRIVVLPDWQGVGVARAFLHALGDLYAREGRALHLLTSHAMMIRCLSAACDWKVGHVNRHGSHESGGTEVRTVSHRPGVSFSYVGDGPATPARPPQ
jgi:GNAT superfamily N-acetyltransferase